MRDRSKIHVAHVIFRLDMGGMETGLINLVNRLDADSFHHSIISLEQPTEFAQRITARNVEIHTIEKRPGKDIGAYRRLYVLLKQLRPGIVHTRNVGTIDMSVVAAAAGVPHRIHGEHGWELSDVESARPRYLRLRRACHPFIERFVCVTRHLESWLEDTIGIPSGKIMHIPNGVDTDRFFAWPRPERRVFAGMPLPGDSLVIGTVGRLIRLKNHRLLLRAFRSLLQRLPRPDAERLRLVIVGDGPERGELAAMASEPDLMGRVWLAGRRDDVADLMRSFDVFVLPSMQEGMSNTLLEAMATGLPLVASAVGGNVELVEDDVTGALVPSEDESALASRLERYVFDDALRRRHGLGARHAAESRYSLISMTQAYSALYRGVVRLPLRARDGLCAG